MWQEEVVEAILSVRTCSWKFQSAISIDPLKAQGSSCLCYSPSTDDSAEVLSQGLCLHTVPTSEFKGIPKVC